MTAVSFVDESAVMENATMEIAVLEAGVRPDRVPDVEPAVASPVRGSGHLRLAAACVALGGFGVGFDRVEP